jgi:hypothetical protein
MSVNMHFLHSHVDFLSGKVLGAERWARRTFPSRYLCSGEEIPGKVEVIDVSRQLLDDNK